MNHEWRIEYEIPPLRVIYYTIAFAPTREAAERQVQQDHPASAIRIRKIDKHQKPPLTDSIADLVSHMLSVAAQMEDAGKDDSEVAQHAQELLGAVLKVRTRIDGLREKEGQE